MPKATDLLCKSHRDLHESKLSQSGTHTNYLGLFSISIRNIKATYTKRGRAMRPLAKCFLAPGGLGRAQDLSQATLRFSYHGRAVSVVI